MEEVFDLIIVGAGPAGLTASIYAKRAQLKTLLIEMYTAGGQILNTYEVDNYPGIPGVSGAELATRFSEHADKYTPDRIMAEVERIEFEGGNHKVFTSEGNFAAKTLILATGNSPRKLGIEGEEEYSGAGVSYCATCDGAFYKGLDVAVIGGGDVAVEDAIFLARGCNKVYLVHRRDELRAAKVLQTAMKNTPNIETVLNSVPKSITGNEDGEVSGLMITDVKSQESKTLDVSGVFVAIGNNPNSSYLDKIEKDDNGYIVADESCKTNIPGVFVAGDLRTKRLRQVSTAVADGANAVYSAEEYLALGR